MEITRMPDSKTHVAHLNTGEIAVGIGMNLLFALLRVIFAFWVVLTPSPGVMRDGIYFRRESKQLDIPTKYV